MSPAGWVTLALVIAAALLLGVARLRPDLVGLLVALGLALTGILSPEQALSGFSQAAVIAILSLFIITHGLERTGVTGWLGRRLVRVAGTSERNLIAGLMLTSAVLSLFMNSIAAAAVLLPTGIAVARQAELRPSRLLMPVAFGALVGGTATLLTSANLIVSESLRQSGLQPYGLLDFLPVGLPLVIVSVLLVVWLAPRLLPQRDPAGEVDRMRRLRGGLSKVYHLQEGTCEVVVRSGSPLADQTLGDAGWGRSLGLTVLGIAHRGRLRLAPDRDALVRAGDVLLLEGMPTPDQMERLGLEPSFQADLSNSLATEQVPLVEMVLAPRSEFEGRTLREIRFRDRYGLQALAIWREGLVLQQSVADIALRFGDAILAQGPREKVELLHLDRNFLILEEEAGGRPPARGFLAAGIFVASLGTAAVGWLPVSLAMLAAAVLMVVTGCLTMDEAYRSVEWKVVFLIAGMLPLSLALQQTGAAAAVADGLLQVFGAWGSLAVAGALLLGTIGLSLVLTGQAAAFIMAPVAISAAALGGADARAMAMAVAIGCSLAFVSPLGHTANLLVMGPGGYTVRDYARLGLPVVLATLVVTLAGLRWVWGL
jgi:di/tricarboxylate transporter